MSNLPVVEKLTTRRDRNREHARKSRLRKKLLVVAQQQRLTELEHTNRILVGAVAHVSNEFFVPWKFHEGTAVRNFHWRNSVPLVLQREPERVDGHA